MDPYENTLEGIRAYLRLPSDLPGPYPYTIRDENRGVLGPLTRFLHFTHGAEVGVWEGLNSQDLCRGNPNLHLLCVDAWSPYRGYRDHTIPRSFRRAEALARARLSPHTVTFLKGWSVEMAAQVPDHSLDFVYIDANHSFEGVTQDLDAWVPKVRSGGIISGHDYFEEPKADGIRVVEAVHAWTAAHEVEPWFVLGRKKAVKGERWEKCRSFFWVKR